MEICKIDGCDNKILAKELCSPHYQKAWKYGDPTIVKQIQIRDGRICEVEGCNNKHLAHGLCSTHYTRFRRTGSVELSINNRNKTHGMSFSPEYATWAAMKQRCYNENIDGYKNYGGRGIIICERWLYSFENFYLDMGKKPFPKAQIDRIDNEGNYEPGNCEWVTSRTNMRHTTITKLTMDKARIIRGLFAYTYLSYTGIGELFGVSRHAVRAIINNKIWKELEL